MVFGKSFILQDASARNESSSDGCLPFHKTNESNAFTCIDAEHYAGIQTAEHNDGLQEHQSGAKCRWPNFTSWNDTLFASTTRNARVPGMKLITMAVSGVWPLFVLPMVFLILSTELSLARKNRVRLETYRAELLQASISPDYQARKVIAQLTQQ